MKSKVMGESHDKTYAVVFSTGEEAMDGLRTFASERRLTASRFTAIGAFSEVVLGYFDWTTKKYKPIPLNEQVEVLALVGDIAAEGNQSKVHAHVVVGMRDGTARGGHLLSGKVRPTLEVILTESPSHLHRVFDAESGLLLLMP
jgi:predicted DNA-binding protein with PD1-like motif